MGGAQDDVRCPTCDATAPSAASFCGRCGAMLGGPHVGDTDHGFGAGHDDEDGPSGETTVLDATTTASGPGAATQRRVRDRRTTLVVAMGVAVLVVLVAASLRPSIDAIVVGDGLTVASGAGPTTVPERRWDTELALVDTLPPVVAAETIVVAGRSGRGAALIGVDRSSGRRLWAAPVGDGPPLSLAAIDGDVVVVAGAGTGSATVSRLSARTGTDVWQQPTTVSGRPDAVVGLPDGGSLVSVRTEPDDARTVVVDGTGAVVLDERGGRTTASATMIARLDGRTVHLHDHDGAPRGTVELGWPAVAADTQLGIVDDVLVVAEGTVTRGFDVSSGRERWTQRTDAAVAALAASSQGVAVVTRGEHLGVDSDGDVVWRDRGFPLPLVRDGDAVTLLVAPGSDVELDLRLVDGTGDLLEDAIVTRGTYLALGRSHVFVAIGDDVAAVPFDGSTGPWSVGTDGDVRWLLLDGPTMVAVSPDRGGTILSSWG